VGTGFSKNEAPQMALRASFDPDFMINQVMAESLRSYALLDYAGKNIGFA